jgi:hypothetical protein
VSLNDELVQATGLPAPRGDPLVHYSPSVEVRIGWAHRHPEFLDRREPRLRWKSSSKRQRRGEG